MNKLREMIESRAAKIAAMETILNAAEASESGEMTPEQRASYDAAKAEVTALDAKIAERQALEESRKSDEAARAALERSVNPAPQPEKENRDFKKFNFCKALRQAKRGRLDGIEAEMNAEGESEARAAQVSFNDAALILPRALVMNLGETRGLAAGTNAAGGYLVPTDAPRTIFDMFASAQVLSALGVTLFDGLQGNMPLPALATDITATATGETSTISASSPTFNAPTLTPHRIGANVAVSNQLLLQNSASVQTWIAEKLMSSVFVKLQDLIINGTSENVITGIINTTGVSAIAASSAAPTYKKFAEMLAGIVGKNADLTKLAYLINAKTESFLISTPKSSGGDVMMMNEARNPDGSHSICGFRSFTSDVLPANGTTGSGDNAVTGLSTALFGKWDDVTIGQWGGIGLINDPLTKAADGETRLIVESFFDAKIIRPSSFAVMTNALC